MDILCFPLAIYAAEAKKSTFQTASQYSTRISFILPQSIHFISFRILVMQHSTSSNYTPKSSKN